MPADVTGVTDQIHPLLPYLWAKTPPHPSGAWHPLVLHLLDVAASADAILALEPESTRRRMADALGLQWAEGHPWLLFVIACHDLGKACPAFQAQWRDLLPRTGLRCPPLSGRTKVHHGFVSQVALAKILVENFGWPEELADMAADAVGCHHGERASENAKDAAKLALQSGNAEVRKDWDNARSTIVTALRQVFHPGAAPTKATLSGPDFMLLAGLTSFADWIGSNEEYFTFGTESDCRDLTGWFDARRSIADRALSAIGWQPRSPLSSSEEVFERVFNRQPRPLQRAMHEILREIGEPAVLLVEAPMGEGKTEAALYAHLELQRRFGHRGLYVALPSKATGNAMFKRVRDFLDGRGGDRTLDLQLLHGGKSLNDEFQQLRLARIDDVRAGGGVRAAEWFTHKKRSLLSEYGVGTIDQALVPILPVRHNFVRLWGLANRVVVLDEVHAYDAYTGTLLEHLVRWLQALGSSVVLLSATLSPSIRRKLANAAGAHMASNEVAYPRLSIFRRGRVVEQRHFDADAGRRMTIPLRRISPDIKNVRATLEEAVAPGGMVMALVNTVQRAQDLYRQFPDGAPVSKDGVRVGKRLSDGTAILLFHARFRADDRQKREDHVLATFGPDDRQEERCILIATQVAEQSLDLDFDVIVTDLAPIDLVLQRAGRLWRHQPRNRPRSEPLLFIAGLAGDEPPSFVGPLWWGKVYREDLLLRTWSLLREHQSITVPDDIDSMVKAVYEEENEVPESLRARLEKATEVADGETSAHRIQAHMSIIGLPDDASWNDPARFVLYDEDQPDVHRTMMAQTRMGQDSVLAIPIFPGDSFQPDAVPHATQAKQWFLRSISLSRPSVVKTLRRLGVPTGWEKSPLLRTCYALTLDSENRWTAMANVRLDDELGLVYEPMEAK
jgi:CRISPR-associated endonuclease/helicase Cas3